MLYKKGDKYIDVETQAYNTMIEDARKKFLKKLDHDIDEADKKVSRLLDIRHALVGEY